MKKFLRFIGILLLILILIVVILGLIGPKEVTVERSIVINAPRAAVWDQMVNFKNGPNWDPWYRVDSTAARNYFGTDGQPGSGYSWVGKKMGEGNMKNTGVEGDKMNYSLHFDKPFKADATGFYAVTDQGGAVKVTWNYHQQLSFIMSAMQPIMSMDKMLGTQFDSGLNNLKRYVENSKMDMSAAVHEMPFPAHTYAGVRKTVAQADIMKFFDETAPTLAKELPGIIGPEAGLYYTWDTAKHNTDMAVVYQIADSVKTVKGATVFHINAARSVMLQHKGGYSNMMADHMAIMKYMADKGLKRAMTVEEYAVDKTKEPDSTKWVTNIYYLIQ